MPWWLRFAKTGEARRADVPKKWSSYLEDRISKPLLDRIAARRRSCFAYLETIKGESYGVEKDGPERKTLLREMREITPQFSIWETSQRDEELAILDMIACIFSIIHEVRGKRHIYGTKHPTSRPCSTPGCTTGRYPALRADPGAPAAAHPLAHLLRGTVGEHIERAKQIMDGNLVLEHEPEWSVMGISCPRYSMRESANNFDTSRHCRHGQRRLQALKIGTLINEHF